MPLWPPTSWTRTDIPDLFEFSFALAGAGCGAWTALAEAADRTLPATLVAGAAVGTVIAKFVSKHVERKAKAAKEREVKAVVAGVVRAILDRMRDEYFATEAGAEKFKHRVTLFVCEEYDGSAGTQKRLAIFARSGVHLNSKCTWQLDDNHPDGCRGVAGKIWYHSITDMKVAECDWPGDNDRVLKARYAESMGVTIEEAETLNVKSRAFAGAPVLVAGRKWGVLLLDSLKDGLIADNSYKKGLLNTYTQLIGRVLTEAGA